uniref:DUF7870 domain-containing protein n=1 Tax=Oryza barthii TaxID=65489 RepID=A0A0D3GTN6_9ORYZ
MATMRKLAARDGRAASNGRLLRLVARAALLAVVVLSLVSLRLALSPATAVGDDGELYLPVLLAEVSDRGYLRHGSRSVFVGDAGSWAPFLERHHVAVFRAGKLRELADESVDAVLFDGDAVQLGAVNRVLKLGGVAAGFATSGSSTLQLPDNYKAVFAHRSEAAIAFAWLEGNVREEDYVVVKAGVEAVEEILRRRAAVRRVDELFLDCDAGAGADAARRPYWECLALYGRLRDHGVAVHQWWELMNARPRRERKKRERERERERETRERERSSRANCAACNGGREDSEAPTAIRIKAWGARSSTSTLGLVFAGLYNQRSDVEVRRPREPTALWLARELNTPRAPLHAASQRWTGRRWWCSARAGAGCRRRRAATSWAVAAGVSAMVLTALKRSLTQTKDSAAARTLLFPHSTVTVTPFFLFVPS